MQLSSKSRAFNGGVDLRGPLALSVTQRQGGARQLRRPRPTDSSHRNHHQPSGQTDAAAEDAAQTPSEQLDPSSAAQQEEHDEEFERLLHNNADLGEIIADRALRLVALLREAPDVKAPPGVPCEGKVVNFDAAMAFVMRYCRMVLGAGADMARPRVTYHWTAEENFQSIVETNLRVPNPETNGVKKKHGAAFGRGVYTCPDFKMAKEDFSYGAAATFVCLCLPGRQRVRRHSPGQGLKECKGKSFDSVIGLLPNRYVHTWVFPESSQLLPCFLVDEIAIPAALAVLKQAMQIFHEPWPEALVATSLSGSLESNAPKTLAEMDFSDEEQAEDENAEADANEESAPPPAHDSSKLLRQEEKQSSPAGLPEHELQAAAWRLGRRQKAMDGLVAAAPGASRQEQHEPRDAETSPAAATVPAAAADKLAALSGRGRRWGGRSTTASDGKSTLETDAGYPPQPQQQQQQQQQQQPPPGTLVVKAGSILDATEDYIVHQCNCVSATPAQGVAEVIFAAFASADVYSQRASRGRPHDIPGSVSVHGRIVNLYGQLLPGRPADDAPPGGWLGTSRYVTPSEAASDTRRARLRWFEAALASLPRSLPTDRKILSIALPAKIGCGLAGGNWPKYLRTLRDFAAAHSDWRLVVYDIEGPAVEEESASKIKAPAPLQQSSCPPSVPRGAGAGAGALTGPGLCSHFWQTASFEALRDGIWEQYSSAEQCLLREAVKSPDACEEALVDAARHLAVQAVNESSGSSRETQKATAGTMPELQISLAGPAVRFHRRCRDGGSSEEVDVSLAAIVSGLGYGREQNLTSHCQGSSSSCKPVPVRLRLPPVREGEVKLPDELDEGEGAPAPRSCGRLVDGEEELTALSKAHGSCTICLESLQTEDDGKRRKRANAGRPVVQLSCGHAFHEACLARWFEERRNCPACKRRFGHLVGRQPRIGTMSWHLDSTLRLPGNLDCFTIVINFNFPPGVDGMAQRYRGRSQRAYLPHDERGKLLLELYQVAFKRRVLFDLHVSTGSDDKYWPAFNIHLKTQVNGGPEHFGFPDDGYFHRAMEELKENGVTVAELP